MGTRAKKPATVLPPPETTEKKLNQSEELFCIFITRPRTETFDNNTLSYADAYNYKLEDLDNKKKKAKGGKRNTSEYDRAYAVCAVEGGKLFKKPYIQARIQFKLNELYGSEDSINAHLAHIAYQMDDRSVSLSAMRDINKLRRRLGPQVEDDDTDDAQPIQSIEIIMPPGAKVKVK